MIKWYQDIAEEVYYLQYMKKSSKIKSTIVVRDTIYLLLLMSVFLFETFLVSYIGKFPVVILNSFRYSYLCYDYKR